MKLSLLIDYLSGRPLLTRSDLTIRLRVSERHLDRIRHDPGFPKPIHVRGPRWTIQQIEAYERKLAAK